MYRQGLLDLKEHAKAGAFISVADFSKHFATVFADKLGSDACNFAEIVQQVSGRAEDMAPEQKELRSRARHILRACQPFLEDAIRKESELTGRPFAQQMKELDDVLLSRRNSIADYPMEDAPIVESIEDKPNGTSEESHDVEMTNGDEQQEALTNGEVSAKQEADAEPSAPELKASSGPSATTPPVSTNGNGFKADIEPVQAPPAHDTVTNGQPEPPTPPMSLENQGQSQHSHPAIGHGGIPWYVEQFDPSGTTIFEERWTGQQVLRELSEELSEMDEDELQGLRGEDDIVGGPVESTIIDEADVLVAEGGKTTRGNKKARGARKSGGQWGDRSFRQRRWR
jgi:NuA3 HAT complex component NTO1